jgi:hypothetical protein
VDVLVQVARSAAMFTARRKIQKEKGQEPDEFEESVAQVCLLCRSRNFASAGDWCSVDGETRVSPIAAPFTGHSVVVLSSCISV